MTNSTELEAITRSLDHCADQMDAMHNAITQVFHLQVVPVSLSIQPSELLDTSFCEILSLACHSHLVPCSLPKDIFVTCLKALFVGLKTMT